MEQILCLVKLTMDPHGTNGQYLKNVLTLLPTLLIKRVNSQSIEEGEGMPGWSTQTQNPLDQAVLEFYQEETQGRPDKFEPPQQFQRICKMFSHLKDFLSY